MTSDRVLRIVFFFAVCLITVGAYGQYYVLTGEMKPVAGNGTQGSIGDGGPATSAELGASLGALAFDASKNIYIADAGNDVIRKISLSGTISRVAGTTGTAGYTGDGGAGTSATISGPVAIAFDAAGNMYFSESGNSLIRKVDTSGNISTYKALGFAPGGIAIDGTGNIYIADPANNKVWKLDTSQNLSAFAGTGTAAYTGDSGAATSATLNAPATVATDTLGNVFIADTGNSAIRKVSSSSTITTVAGNGTAGFSGDGGAATSAMLDHPLGIVVDPIHDLFITDTNNQVIREVNSAGVILTIGGTHGSAGYSGDNGPGLLAHVSKPAFPLLDLVSFTLYFADVNNFAVRKLGAATGLNFGNQTVLTTSTPLAVLLFNASPTSGGITSVTATGDFAVDNSSTCTTSTTLAGGGICVVYVTFTPSATGPATGTLSLAGGTNGTQNLALTGTGQAALVNTTTALQSSINPALTTDTLTLTATVTPASGTTVPTGTVNFLNGSTSLGTGTLNSSGVATLGGVQFSSAGSYSLTADYGGDTNFNGSTSAALAETINTPAPPDYSVSLNPTSLMIHRGSSGSTTVTVTPTNGFTGTVTITCSGLPANTSCTGGNITVSSGAATGTLTINTNISARLVMPGDGTTLASQHGSPSHLPFGLLGTGVIGIVFSLGGSQLRRSNGRGHGGLLGLLMLAVIAVSVLLMPACSSSSGPKSPTGTSTVMVTATSGSTTHTTSMTLTIQ